MLFTNSPFYPLHGNTSLVLSGHPKYAKNLVFGIDYAIKKLFFISGVLYSAPISHQSYILYMVQLYVKFVKTIFTNSKRICNLIT